VNVLAAARQTGVLVALGVLSVVAGGLSVGAWLQLRRERRHRPD
jgi:hypothetical protein